MSAGEPPGTPPAPESLTRIIATVSFLKQVDLFREVPADYLVAVAQLAEERTCWAGEQLFAEGEPGDCLYLIGDGEIRVQARGVDVARLSAGEVVGEMAVLDSHPRSATAIVEKGGKLLRIGSEDFRLLLLSHPEMAMTLLRTLARRLRAAPSDAPFLDALEDGRLGEGPAPAPASGGSELLRTFAPALEHLLPSMEAGTLLADRFRLSEALGTTRYAAEDVRLGEPVIVQLLPPAMTRDAATLEELRKRVAAARRFSHRNVQRAFDLVVGGETSFVTLEHVAGPTLAARVADAGVIPFDEAWALAAQLAASLAALEEAGLPLPTLTPSSIVLVPASTSLEATRRWRLVLPAIDFRETDAGADVTAFGRLLVEMLTDRRDSTSTDGLDPRAAALVKRCFGLAGEKRFRSFAELDEALSGAVVVSPARRAAAAGALAIVALLAGFLGDRVLRPAAPPASATAPQLEPGRRAVAVLGLAQSGGTPASAWIGTALAEMLASEIGAGGRVRVVTPDLVARARTELSVPPGEEPAPALLGTLRARLGADVFVSGSFAPAGGDVRLDLRLLDAGSGRVLAEVGESTSEGKLFDLAQRLGARLRYELRLGDVSARQAAEVRAVLPESAEAARLYADGLAKLRTLDAAEARTLLAKAVEAEPFHAPARAALARAHAALGYDRLAREEARKAHELSLDLPREAQLAIEARYRELAGERGKAAELYRKLVAAAPDDPDPALALASVLVADGKGKEALPVVSALRRTKAGAADPRVDLAEAEVAAAQGDLARQLASARRAAERGRAAGALQLVARARVQEANALLTSKNAPEAREALLDAQRLFEGAGDRAGAARALTRLANVALDSKDGGEAVKRLRDAIDLFREIEDQRGIVDSLVEYSWALRVSGEGAAARKAAQQAKALADELGDARLRITAANALAGAHQLVGDQDAALTLFREALVVAREAGEDLKRVTLLNNAAAILLMKNDPEAVVLYEEGIALARRIGEKRMLPMSLMNLSIIQVQHGRLDAARAANEEAVGICRETGNQRALGYALSGLANVEASRGETVAARKHFEEAKALHVALGDAVQVTLLDFYVSTVDLAEERFEEALGRASRTAEWGAAHGNPLVECTALVVKARVLGELGRHREVLEVVARAKTRATNLPEVLRASRVDELRSRAFLGTATKKAAVRELDVIAKEARGRDLGLTFDALLAAAELEADPARRLERLDAVLAEAKNLGFGVVVRKAEKARAAGAEKEESGGGPP